MNITLFYDGKCSACYYEMLIYKKIDKHSRLNFMDISKADFDHNEYKVTKKDINREFHVLTEDGMKIGVPAFVEIWKSLDLKKLAAFIQLPGVFLVSKLGYKAFVVARPYLPKKAGRCSIEDL